jgi:hypothetical protein
MPTEILKQEVAMKINLVICFKIICLLSSTFAYSQRKRSAEIKGASLNYLPISISGLPDCNYNNSNLVLSFADEFNGSTLDTSKWNSKYPWGEANDDSSSSWCDPKEISFTGNSVKLGCNLNPNATIY